MTSEQLNEILRALRKRMRTASIDEFDHMIDAQKALKDWGQGGFQGEVPYVEDLRGWNIDLPALRGASAALVPTPEEVECIMLDLRTLLVDGHPEQLAIREAFRDVQGWQANQMSGPLPYAEHLARWGVWPPRVTKSTNGGDMPEAKERQVVDNAYTDARYQLEAQTNRLVQAAQNAERRFPNDPFRQKRAWQDVLKINPDSREANQALARLARQEADLKLASQLEPTLTRARIAAENEQLPELNKLLGQVEAWKALGKKDPPEISESLYQQVVELEEEVSQLRRRTRRQLAISVRLLNKGDYRLAYRHARDLFGRTVPTLVDAEGILGQAHEEINTVQFFSKARELFISDLQSLVGQRLSQAEEEEKQGWPGLALETLDQAINSLTDEVLSPDDKLELKPELERVKQKRREVLQQIEKYNAAKAKVVEAHSPNKKPSEMLALFLAAKEEYAVYPNLDIYIEQAQSKVALMIASEVANAMAKARRHMMRDEYQKTFEILTSARNKAIQHLPNPKLDYITQILIGKLATFEEEIAQIEGTYYQMMNLLAEVDKMFQRFDTGTSQALSSARHLLNQFSEEEKRHSEVRKRLAALAEREEK